MKTPKNIKSIIAMNTFFYVFKIALLVPLFAAKVFAFTNLVLLKRLTRLDHITNSFFQTHKKTLLGLCNNKISKQSC